jgi:hypothetical protein
VRNRRAQALILLALLLPLPARAALTPVGSPRVISEVGFCSSSPGVEVVATPVGAFEVVWVDDEDFKVRGQRFARNLAPTGSPVELMTLHGGLFLSDLVGAWTGRYQLAFNGADFGDHVENPATGYRVTMNLAGHPVAPPLVVRPPGFFSLTPAAGGDSLRLRLEPPIFGSPACQSYGLLASRIDEHGAPLSPESPATRRASAVSYGYGFHTRVERLPDDTFVLVYPTCEKFTGLVARHLNATGVPVGSPINLPLPAPLVNFSALSSLVLAARGGADLAVAAVVDDNLDSGVRGIYTQGVVNGEVFGPTRISSDFVSVAGLAASPAGGYLLLLLRGDSEALGLFAQELDARGIPQGSPLKVAEAENTGRGLAAAVASLPNGRWVIATQEQHGTDPLLDCGERVVVTILDSN